MLLSFDEPLIGAADLPEPSAFTAFVPFIKGVFSQWYRTPGAAWLNEIVDR
jgi:hypothetical protein